MRTLRCILPCITLLTAGEAAAHIAMIAPSPRDPNGTYQVIPPCGDRPETAPTTLQAGSTLEVSWHNQIAHPGTYRISLAADANTFTQHVILDNIPSPDSIGEQSQDVTLPAEACSPCTLQLVQVNTSGTASTPSGYIEYVACADVDVVVPAGGSTPSPGPSPTSTGETGSAATPTPTPTSTVTQGTLTDPAPDNSGCVAAPVQNLSAIVAACWLVRRRIARARDTAV